MNIVIPSYEKHFTYNKNFLESFNKYCIDKEKVKIYFIIDDYNISLFNDLKKYGDNVNIINFMDLIKFVDSGTYDIRYLSKYPRLACKKLFAGFLFKEDYIVMDSENLCLKDFYMKDIFNNIKDKPIIYTKNITQPIQINVKNNCSNILEEKSDNWYFLKSYWFFEYEIISNMINELKLKHTYVFNLLKNLTFFEYQLYGQYIEKYKLKNILEIETILNNNIINNLNNSPLGKANYEHICCIMNNETVDDYCKLLNDNDERIIRLHWMDEKYKNYIIENTNVCIGTFHWD